MAWTRGRTIGRGSSAVVSLATAASGNVFAVKSAELSQSEFLQRELSILSSLTSPHVVSYLGHDVTRESNNKLMYNILMEYASGGTIIDTIRKRKGEIEEAEVRFYTREIVKGVEYLHKAGLVHCDIKGRNILVCDNKSAKIADFGCARWANEALPIGGTPMFMSPEAARGEEQSFPCDVWAIGCTVIEIATGGSLPWPNAADPASVLYRIAYSGVSPEIPGFLSDEARDFLGKCFVRDPKQRWTVTQLLKHPFLDDKKMINNSSKVVKDSVFTSFSPTSILDQGIWNSLQELQSLSKPRIGNNSDDRIRRLSMFSETPSWSFDEDCWITVRGNDCGESNRRADEGEAQSDVIGSIISSKIRKIITSSRNSSSISSSRLVALSNLNFERHKENLQLFPSIPIF